MQINTVFGIRSTGSICRDIENELDGECCEFYMAYSHPGPVLPRRGYVFGSTLDQKIHALASRATGLQGYFSADSTRKLIKKIDSLGIDIVHIHNIHSNNINLDILFSFLAENKIGTILTLHDCWFYTGKCMHYTSSGCLKWQTTCSHCPQLREGNPSWFMDRTQKMQAEKFKMFSRLDRLGVVGVSDWITSEAKKSILKNANIIRRIYNWIDIDIYKLNKDACTTRKQFGFSVKDFVIIAVASTWTERKGLNFLIDCAISLRSEVKFVVVGQIPAHLDLPNNILHIPETHDVAMLASLYAAADALINPSKEETFGKVTAEAMAAGTPVIVMNSTASPELVGPNCGYIIDDSDINSVSEAVREMKAKGKHYFSGFCREHALLNFEMKSQINQYKTLYFDLVN